MREACKAARRRDRTSLDSNLTRFNESAILDRIALDSALTGPISIQRRSLEDQLPAWMRQIIRDQGLRIGENVFIRKGPGTAGLKLELRW